VPIVLKSGSLNLLEPSGPVQACNGNALPFLLTIFSLISKMNDYDIIPLINGPSDQDAQLIILNYIQNQPYEHQSCFKRNINKYTTEDLQIKLSFETWGSVFNGNDVIVIFNFF
jgi:hypothetical protein